MKLKSVIYSFFLGGLLALVAQAIAAVWTTVLPGTPLEFFMGGATLVSMGVLGFVLAGFAVYQRFEEWATFGALLPFSGFSMAVGMKMVVPWTKGANMKDTIWPGLWLVIWFNAVGAIVCIAFGYLCGIMGVAPVVAAKTTSSLIFPGAFLMGGILCAVFQIVYLAVKAITPKCKPVWILMTAWMVGALLAPIGVSGSLVNMFGQGFAVMIPIGGYNMFNVGMAFAAGEMAEGLIHLGSFLLAVLGLFVCGLMTFVIYNSKFGRTPLKQVHLQQAQASVEELSETEAAPKHAQKTPALDGDLEFKGAH
ncbi:SpoVA/SpoVAEb family sporulation membrane protein [Xiamenia xianingshaonis]|uniref:SpoVA/SpoVAEb family sporulation membrane protein n=1 Tax=Xiamenia xianingshaonis TaxID=2682776 RepID=A0A9E6SUF7_9ACTN|nr:SpoVA/SpoVAEb family sporulation membrane protein [Xiamenia xianingshaonis]NHM13467.1 SpoVA/SpoVAEb family sporulation membrane protein [Xiamenia xianingshaonis]QTU84458.1 SpoVA/SpoVAEb family sporulation membrane protein [Xiamenia xianingshaonis]